VYKPALTGVRFVGVFFVMLYHANVPWMQGGFFMLDVFFVLSGFLITSLLVSEMTETGNLRLGRFWSRRAKRLVPALFVLLAAVAIYAALVPNPLGAADLRGDGIAALFYVSNWRFALSGASYFDNFNPSLFRHTWSLSIEEQFYVVWPLLFIAGYKVLKGRLELMALIAGIGAIASALWMGFLYEPGVNPSRIYYGTDTRLQALLIGVGLALISRGNTRRFLPEKWIHVLGWMGYAAFALLLVVTDPNDEWIFRGGFMLFSLISAFVVFAHAGPDTTRLNRMIGWLPILWLGSLTYGLYLWQWPVFIVLDEARTGIGGVPLFALQFTVTLALSAASYYLVETPIRRSSFAFRSGARSAYAIVGAAVTVVVLFIVSTSIFGTAGPASASDAAPHVLVVGDSTGYAMAAQYPGTGDLKVDSAAVQGCGIVRGENKPVAGMLNIRSTCETWPEDWKQGLARSKPEVIVLATGAWERFDKIVDGKLLAVGSPEWKTYARSEFEYALSLTEGRPVIMLNAPCTRSLPSVNGPAVQEGNDGRRLDDVNALMSEFAAAHPEQIHLLDLKALLCPNGTFEPKIDGVEARPDGVHYNTAGAALVWRWLAPQVQQLLDAKGPKK